MVEGEHTRGRWGGGGGGVGKKILELSLYNQFLPMSMLFLFTAVYFCAFFIRSYFSTHSVGYRGSINQGPFSSESRAINMYRY